MQYRTVLRLSTLVLTILVGSWLADAQGPTKVPRLGMLFQGSQGPSPGPALQAFLQRLHNLGYREGENLRIDYRFAAQQLDRLPTLADELVALQPDALFTSGPLRCGPPNRPPRRSPLWLGPLPTSSPKASSRA